MRPVTFVWRPVTRMRGSVARFSATGLASATRPKVKTVKKEATRVNNIVGKCERGLLKLEGELVIERTVTVVDAFS